MKLTRKDLERAVETGIMSTEQSDRLWEALEQQQKDQPRFDLPHVAYYFGALIVIAAMGWFMTEAWETFGGGGILLISITYGVCFIFAGRTLWHERGLKVPGGLLFTMAVSMTPLAIYGFERLTGLWPQADPGPYREFHMWIRGGWFLMEVGTIAAGLAALRYVHFPFLTAPVAFTLWYVSMDLTPLLFGPSGFLWNQRLWVSLWFGLGVLLVAYFIDRRTKEDFAFWLYLFGLFAFWGGLSFMKSESELNRFFYFLINLGLMAVSVVLRRRVFIVFGAAGVFGYIGYLAHRIFKDSLLFPFVLSLIGIAIIYLGIKAQRRRSQIESAVLGHVPEWLRRLMPTNRAG
jgi:hypothetical protein